MALGKIIKSIFGSSAEAKPKDLVAVEYESFKIEADPINEDGKYRLAGFISGEKAGETRRIRFIRADQLSDEQSAIDQSIKKAQQIIDEQGQSLLDKSHL